MSHKTGTNLTEAELAQRQGSALSHGANSYVRRVEAGELITASMGVVESEVVRLLADGGPRALIEAAGVRFETMARLVYQHLERAEPADAIRLALLWRQFQHSAVRTWAALANLPSPDDGDGVEALQAKYRSDGEPA
jgi:hypothetical protein